MTTSILNTAVAVPQVAFITSNSAVGLVAGTPPPIAAATTNSNANLPFQSLAGVSPVAPAIAPAAVPGVGIASGSGAPVAGPASASVLPFTGVGSRLTAQLIVTYFILAIASFVALA